MMRVLARSLAAAIPLTAAVAVAGTSTASAHERRTVGTFVFVVGWGDEPTYTGFKNSVQVTVAEANGGAPVTNAGESFAVEVIKGSDKTTIPLVAWGTPGDYRAWLTPTRPGSYTFRLTGAVRGQIVDETFTSSRTSFNDVDDVANSAFPAKDPSAGQLATRVDREVPRLDAALRKAEDQATSARTLAVAGLAVGALGLLAAAGAVMMARRHGTTADADGERERARPPTEAPESLIR